MVKSSQNNVRPPLAVSSIGKNDSLDRTVRKQRSLQTEHQGSNPGKQPTLIFVEKEEPATAGVGVAVESFQN